MLQSMDTQDTLLFHKARTKARASSMPMHNKCNAIKKKTQHLLSVSYVCNRGHDTGNTVLLHKARTKAHASSMPVSK